MILRVLRAERIKYRRAPVSQGPMARKESSSCNRRTTVVRNS